MTIKEIAEVAGVSYPTVHKAVSKIYQGKMKDGKKTDLSYEEAVKVMKALRKKNFVSPIQNEQVSSQNENLELSDYELNRAFRLAMVNMNNLAQSLANKTDELDKRMSNIEVQTEKRKALLPPPQIKPRDHINMIAKTFEPTKKENKSKKLLLLLKPTLHEILKTKAASFDMSINELVNQILEQNV